MFLVSLVLSLASIVIVFAYFRNQRFIKQIEAKTKRFDAIMNRFESTKELNDFLKGDDGEQFIELFSENKWDPHPLISGTLIMSILSLSWAVGAFFLMIYVEFDMVFPFTASSTIGTGLLISHFLLKKQAFKQSDQS